MRSSSHSHPRETGSMFQISEDTKGIVGLVAIGAAIALGKLLAGDERITIRLAAGRIILGSATSLVAGMALLQVPDITPLALCGIGSALGIAGAQVVEVVARRWASGGASSSSAPPTKP